MTHDQEWAQRIATAYRDEDEHDEAERVLLDASAHSSPFDVEAPSQDEAARAERVGKWLEGGSS